jgi:hypothetical protein
MRLSFKEVKSLGLINRIPKNVIDSIQNPKNSQKKSRSKVSQINPQQLLLDGLLPIIPEAIAEQKNLIPGRKFRADIYLPSSRLIIEVDGFKEHYFIKENMHKTLDRQNLFTMHGFHTLRYYTSRIYKQLDGVIQEIVETHNNLKSKNF